MMSGVILMLAYFLYCFAIESSEVRQQAYSVQISLYCCVQKSE